MQPTPNLPAIIDSSEPDPTPLTAEVVGQRASGKVSIELSYAEVLLLRQALAHFHDHGPRMRSTRKVMDLMNLLADMTERFPCPFCRGTGMQYAGLREGYEICNCSTGMRSR